MKASANKYKPIHSPLQAAIKSVINHPNRYIIGGGSILLGVSLSGNALALQPVNNDTLVAQTVLSQNRIENIVIIDGQLKDTAELIKAVPTGSKVFHLDIRRDGIDQVSEILGKYKGLASVHLLSHGGPGYVALGNSILKAETLSYYREQLADWGKSLRPGADLMVYGCDTASGSRGQALLEQLASLTGADVAGSTDPTGASAKGGDWNLEYRVGGITASTLSAKNYPHTMDLIVGDGSGGGGGGGGYFYASELDLGGNGGAGGGDDDVLTGTAYADVMFGDGSGGGGAGGYYTGYGTGGAGGGGNDTISGGNGNDILFGDGFDGFDGNGDGLGGDGGLGGGGGGGGGNYTSASRSGGDGGLGGGGGGGGDYGSGGNGGLGGGGGGSGGTTGGASGDGGGLGATDGESTGSDAGGGGGGGGYFGAGGLGSIYTPPDTTAGGDGGSSATGTGNGGSGSTVNNTTDGDYSGGSGGGGFGNGDGGAAGNSTDATETLGRDGANGDTNVYTMPDYNGFANLAAFEVLLQIDTLLTDNPNYGAGNDILDGGPGSDHLFGLGGSDVFVSQLDDATSGSDTDTIWDLNAGDLIAVTSGGTTLDTDTITTALGTQTTPDGTTDRAVVFDDGTNSVTILVKGIDRDLTVDDFATAAFTPPAQVGTPPDPPTVIEEITVVEDDEFLGSFSLWSLFAGFALGLGRLFGRRKRD